MDWLGSLAACLGGVGLGLMLISYVRYANQKGRELAELVTKSHDQCELVDIRSNVFKPNELVATLCVTHDEQLGPEVWQAKIDRELEELGKPKQVSGSTIRTQTHTYPYVPVEPAIEQNVARLRRCIELEGEAISALKQKIEADAAAYSESLWNDPRRNSPMPSWAPDDFRRRGWKPSFKQSNFDHSLQEYVLPFYRERGERTWNTYKLNFHSEAEAQGWWRSSIPYLKYFKQRESVRRFRGRP